jgi:hypothetical protein
MASLTITTRQTKSGPRYVVRFRLGGRSYPIEHAGSFKTMREAKSRRDLIAGEIANGRNPRDLLRTMTASPTPITSLARARDQFLKSRIDADANTIKNYRTALKRACSRFGDRDPNSLTAAEVAEWVAELAQTYKPGTVQQYLIALRLLLDFAGVDEKTFARDPRVKLPKQTREEPQPTLGRAPARDPRSDRPEVAPVVRDDRAGSATARRGPSRCAGATSTRPTCACACHARRRSATAPAGSTCPSG